MAQRLKFVRKCLCNKFELVSITDDQGCQGKNVADVGFFAAKLSWTFGKKSFILFYTHLSVTH
jgi:hypothetical protein